MTQAAAKGEGNYVVTTDQGNEFRELEGPAGAGGAPGEAAERPERHGGDRPERHGGDRPDHPDAEEGPGGEGGPGRRRLGRARGGGDGSLQRPAAPGGDGGAGGRGDEAGGDLPGAPGQRGEVRAQQEPDRLEEAGAFRAPTNAARSFQPQYGPVREVAGYDSMTVRATDGSETLLKQPLPVPRGSGEWRGRLTRPPVPLAVRQLRDFNPGPVAPPCGKTAKPKSKQKLQSS